MVSFFGLRVILTLKNKFIINFTLYESTFNRIEATEKQHCTKMLKADFDQLHTFMTYLRIRGIKQSSP